MTAETSTKYAGFVESLTRFCLGTLGGVAAGGVAFRGAVFSPEHTAFQCITVGALLAGVLTLIRMAPERETLSVAILLVLGYGALRGALAEWERWSAGLVGLLLGAGVLLVALLYDELASVGIRFGKFLVLGPLLGGVYLAIAPLAEGAQLSVFESIRPLLLQLFVGVVIGDGVGLGVEVAESLPFRHAEPQVGLGPEAGEQVPGDAGS